MCSCRLDFLVSMNARKGRREHVAEAAAAAAGNKSKASASNCSSSKTIPMSDEHDAKSLSDSLAFFRRQLEYFQATAEDVEIRKKKGGRHGTVHVGQVGIRCIHCAHRPAEKRSTGAVAFPTSTGMVYQAVRNWQRKSITVNFPHVQRLCLLTIVRVLAHPFCRQRSDEPQKCSLTCLACFHVLTPLSLSMLSLSNSIMCFILLIPHCRIPFHKMPRHHRRNKGRAQVVQTVALRKRH